MDALERIKVIPLYAQTNAQMVICMASSWLVGDYCVKAAEEMEALQADTAEVKTHAYKELLLEIDRSVYPEVYGYIENKILALKGQP